MQQDTNIAQQPGKRWAERSAIREVNRQKLAKGKVTDVESKGAHSKATGQAGGNSLKGKSHTAGLARVIGKSDFLKMDFIELALAIARFVARINIRNSGGKTVGLGNQQLKWIGISKDPTQRPQ